MSMTMQCIHHLFTVNCVVCSHCSKLQCELVLWCLVWRGVDWFFTSIALRAVSAGCPNNYNWASAPNVCVHMCIQQLVSGWG